MDRSTEFGLLTLTVERFLESGKRKVELSRFIKIYRNICNKFGVIPYSDTKVTQLLGDPEIIPEVKPIVFDRIPYCERIDTTKKKRYKPQEGTKRYIRVNQIDKKIAKMKDSFFSNPVLTIYRRKLLEYKDELLNYLDGNEIYNLLNDDRYSFDNLYKDSMLEKDILKGVHTKYV